MSTLYACLTKHPTHEDIISKYGDGKIQNIEISRAAFLNDKQWPDNHIIKVAFMKDTVPETKENGIRTGKILPTEYTPEKAKWVQEVIEKNIMPLVNKISFKWDVNPEDSEVRISFIKKMGAFSIIGNDSIHEDKDIQTMNLGWLDTSDDADFAAAQDTGAVIIHEFGHCLGMIHEHQRSDAPYTWNKSVVEKSLGAAPNNWSPDTCASQIFQQYTIDQFNGSKYDPKSIMHYYFPPNYFIPPQNIPHTTQLSRLDKIWINLKYGDQQLIKTLGEDGDDTVGAKNNLTNWINNHWYLIVILVIVIIILMIVFG